jgi:hypothetical protein
MRPAERGGTVQPVQVGDLDVPREGAGMVEERAMTRKLDGNETVVRDADGDAVVVYSTPDGRVGLGTQRADEDGGFAVLLDRNGVAKVVKALLARALS